MAAIQRILRVLGALALVLALIAGLQSSGSVSAQESTGSLTVALLDNAGSPVSGGCFDITDSAGATQSICDDDGDGLVSLSDLPVGAIAVAQTSGPDGYELAEPASSTIEPGAETRVEQLATASVAETPSVEPETPAPTEAATEPPTTEPVEPTENASTPEPPAPTATATEPASSPEATESPASVSRSEEEVSLAAATTDLGLSFQLIRGVTGPDQEPIIQPGDIVPIGSMMLVRPSYPATFPVPSGTITFLLYSSPTCGGTPASEQVTFGPAGEIPYGSGFAVNVQGVYNFIVQYSGDGNYLSSSTRCGELVFSVGYASAPTHALTTKVTATNAPVANGDDIPYGTFLQIADTMTNVLPTGGSNKGFVEFDLYSGSNCTGRWIGSDTREIRTDLTNTNASARSSILSLLPPGTYSVRAYYYDPSGTNPSNLSTCGVYVTVVKKTPTVSLVLPRTEISRSETNYAQATLTGAILPGGSITYRVYLGEVCAGPAIVTRGDIALVGGAVPASPAISFASAGTVSWSAEYSGDANHNAAVSNCVAMEVHSAQLSAVKSAVPTALNLGDTLRVTTTITNSGQGTAFDVGMVDGLQPGFTWTVDENSTIAGCQIQGATTVNCTVFDLPGNSSRFVTFVGQSVNPACGTSIDGATFSDRLTASQAATPATYKIGCGDAVVSMSLSKNAYEIGNTIEVTIVVENGGDADLATVAVTDNLAAALPGATWTVDPNRTFATCSITNGVLNCTRDLIPAGTYIRVAVTAQVTSAHCGDHQNNASATAANEPSSLTGNNSASKSFSVLCPDVAITKTPVKATVAAGESMGFVLTVQNVGTADAELTVINDTLPTGYTWQFSNSDCEINSGIFSCDFGEIAAGGSRSVTITAQTALDFCGTISNTATTSAKDEPSTKLGNNSATASVKIGCPDLLVTNVPGSATVAPRGQVSFTITVKNIGGADAKGVKLMSGLPYGMDWAGQAMGCVIYPGAIGCDFGTIGAGESRTVTVRATAPGGMCGTLGVYAFAWADNEQPSLTLNNMVYGEVIVRCS